MGGIAVGLASLVVAGALVGPAPAAGPTPSPAKKAATPAPAVPQRAPDEPAFRWKDEHGVVHLSQGLASVPEEFRATAVPLGIISSPPPAKPLKAEPDPRERVALDDALRRARTAYDFLILARRYRTRGFDEQAREAVRRGAGVAVTADEWHAVAATYDTLGMPQAAQQARRRAGEISSVTR